MRVSSPGDDGAIRFAIAPYGCALYHSAMPNYRRLAVPGGCWFFTVALADRRSDLLVRRIDDLRDAVRKVRERRPFSIEAMVVLPDHVHAVWHLPEGDGDFSRRWHLIKRSFSMRIEAGATTVRGGLRPGERGIWQRRFWEHLIRDDDDFANHVAYCHVNPMKHGLVSRVRDWPYSTFHRSVARGDVAIDWAGETDEGDRRR
jgi:putative transposase